MMIWRSIFLLFGVSICNRVCHLMRYLTCWRMLKVSTYRLIPHRFCPVSAYSNCNWIGFKDVLIFIYIFSKSNSLAQVPYRPIDCFNGCLTIQETHPKEGSNLRYPTLRYHHGSARIVEIGRVYWTTCEPGISWRQGHCCWYPFIDGTVVCVL